MKKLKIIIVVIVSNIICLNTAAQWIQTNLPSDDIRCFIANGENIYVGTFGEGVFVSSDNGDNWSVINNGLTNTFVLSLTTTDSGIYAGTYGGGVFHSTIEEVHWTEINSGLTDTIIYSLGVSSTNLIAGTSRDIFLSTNKGKSWNSVLNAYGVSSILVIPMTNDVFAVINSGGELGSSFIYKSTDDGTSWFLSVNGFLFDFWSIPSMTFRFKAGFKIFAAENTFHRIYCSTNSGENWVPTSAVMNDQIIALTIGDFNFPFVVSYLFAGTEANGVLISRDDGTSWEEVNDGLPPGTKINCLIVHEHYLYAGTPTLGVWKRYLSQILIGVKDSPENSQMEGFTLEQNYPNPFNPSTTIRYTIPTSEFVTLRVYDVLGNEIVTLVNDVKLAGSYEVDFDASLLSSGIYFYILQVSDYIETKKMVLMK